MLARASRRLPLPRVARTTLVGTAVILLAAFAILTAWDAPWTSFALLTLVPIIVPVGFIFIVGQAGMLLDVRALKASYGRVVAGFALGSVAGGLSGAPLLGVLGATQGLLVAATVAVVALLVLVEATRLRYPAELSVVERPEPSMARPNLRTLAANRYVLLIVAFQMLSAVESQWLDFHVFASAADRYDSSEALARFVSGFSAVAYGVDILFLVVLAGWLLRRFGLRVGLTANAVGVLVLVVAVIISTWSLGAAATPVFVLIVAARVTDLTLSDGSSRTSLSAAYQAVPGHLRGFAQATVEGLAVPIAIGVSGVVLLAIQAAGGAGGLLLPTLTAVVVCAWVVVAVMTYRAYRGSLLASLRSRTLDPSELAMADEGSLIAIDRLVESHDERDVRLGLDILTIAQHPRLAERLQHLAVDERVGVRTDALQRLVQVAPEMAAAAARAGVDDEHPDVRAASVRVLGLACDPQDRTAIDAAWSDPALEVRVAAAFALSRMNDDAVHADLTVRLDRLIHDADERHRVSGARMLAALDPAAPVDRGVIRALLTDRSPDVVDAALDALRWPEDRAVLPLVVEQLERRRHRRAAVAALVRAGEAALDLVDAGLGDPGLDPHAQEHLVRVARDVGGGAAAAVLQRHIAHPDRDVGLSVMRALAVVAPRSTEPTALEDDPGLPGAVAIADLEHAAGVVQALAAFEDEPSAAQLCDALIDELDLLAARVIAACALGHVTGGFERVSLQLAQPDARSHALALEWLDVTLVGRERAIVVILEPHATHRARLQALSRWFPAPARDRRTILNDIVRDPDDQWRRPWLTACALLAAARDPDERLRAVAERFDDASVAHDRRADIVHETLAGLRAGRRVPG